MSERNLQEAGSGDVLKLAKEAVGTKVKGIYESKKEVELPRGKGTIYSFRKSDGTILSVWGFTVLDYRMAEVPFHRYVEIEYLGKVQNKRGQDVHNCKVLYDPNPIKGAVSAETNDDLPF